MKAIVQESYGSADVLQYKDIDPPPVGEYDVLVAVRAAGVDAGVWHLTAGLPYVTRIIGYGLSRPKNPVPGLDFAGVVEAVGIGVTRFQPGDEVFGTCAGAFAEYAIAHSDRILPKPVRVTFEQAAAVPVSGCTALQALQDKSRVQPGQRVLVTGAGGGVGSFAVQIAKAFGAHVTGVTSTAKTDLVRSLGADEVVDRTQEDFTTRGERYDLVVDTAGRRSLSSLRRVLAGRGTLVVVGGEGGDRVLGGFDRQLRAQAMSPFVPQRMCALMSTVRSADLAELAELIAGGRITPAVDRAYPLSDAAEAIRHLHEGRARGKVVITV